MAPRLAISLLAFFALLPASAQAAPARVTLATSSGKGAVTVRWNVPVRVVNARQVWFVSRAGRRLHGRELTRGVRRSHAFAVLARGSLHLRVGRRAARTRTGHWARAAVLVVRGRRPPTRRTPVVPPPATPPPATPTPTRAPTLPLVTPQSGASFVDSVGVNVHMSYYSTAYDNWQEVRDKLVELGVHHVRDGACVGCTPQRSRLLALASAGIGVDFIMRQPGSPDSAADLVNLLAGPMRPAVDTIEGPNEYDHSGDPSWAPNLLAYQQQIYSLTRANQALAGVPVVGPSLVSSRSYTTLGDLDGMLDTGNIHPYAGGGLPTGTLTSNLNLAGVTAPGRPVMATEAGYHDALSASSGQPPVSEQAAADYIPRLVLDMFRAGVARTYLYELVDERADPALTNAEYHFGLLRNDFSEKPAFQALAALLHLAAPQGGFALAPLELRVDGAPADARQLLLQTGPRSYALVLWRDVKVWDPAKRQPLSVSPASLTVELGREVSGVSVRNLGDSGSSLELPGPAPAVQLSLAGSPVVLAIST